MKECKIFQERVYGSSQIGNELEKEIGNDTQEKFVLLCLNTTNKIVSYVFYLSDIFASPFRGIVSEYIKIEGFANFNIETTPIVALVAYVILAFILSELVKSFNSQG